MGLTRLRGLSLVRGLQGIAVLEPFGVRTRQTSGFYGEDGALGFVDGAVLEVVADDLGGGYERSIGVSIDRILHLVSHT